MRNMYIKKNSGITLIALVITIIILMILVCVTISMLLNGGILEKANMSAEQYSINQAKEELELAIANLQMEEIRRGDVFTKEDLTKLNSDVISVGSTESFPIERIYGKYKFEVNEFFKVTYIGEAEGTIVTYTTSPKGYTNAAEVHVLLNIENPRGIKEVVYPDDNDDRLQCNGRTEVVVDYKVSSNGTYIFKVISNDNKEVTKEVVIDTIDRLAPQNFSITSETTRTGVKIKGEAIDTPADGESICSGIDKYEYYVKKAGTNDEYTKYEVNPITGLEQGTYTVYAVAYDMAGNSVQTEAIEVEAPEVWIEIYNEEDLRNIANDLTKNYILMADIELTQTWIPLGSSKNPFTGKFDGDNHKITGLQNGTTTTNYQGLFRYINNASISNLQLEGNITGTADVGILVGRNENGTITNVYATGTVTGSSTFVGGLVGINYGTITQSYATVEVTGNSDVGGLVGYNGGTITQSYATGKVTGTTYSIGGLVGTNNGGTITQSYATGAVTGSGLVGGLIGRNDYGTTTNSYWTSEKAGVTTSSAGTELTLEEMQTQASYVDWDFDTIWEMKEFPELRL